MSSKHEYLNRKNSKPSNASVLFPEIQKELQKDPSLVGNIQGLIIVEVKNNGISTEEWFMSFYGRQKAPEVTQSKPSIPSTVKVRIAVIEIEDRDIKLFITGGLHGVQAIAENRIKIAGNIELAYEVSEVFLKTGGVEKSKAYFAAHQKSKL